MYGDKDTDGFYKGHLRGGTGLIPCNMVSEIRAEDEETLDQLLKQGFLPLSTPVDRIGMAWSPWGCGLRFLSADLPSVFGFRAEQTRPPPGPGVQEDGRSV